MTQEEPKTGGEAALPRDSSTGGAGVPVASGGEAALPDAAAAQGAEAGGGEFISEFTLFAATMGVIGAVLALLRGITYGPALSSDSLEYVTTARSLAAGGGFVDGAGAAYTAGPPLYPLLLALGGQDALAFAAPLNAVLFGLTIFFAGRYLGRWVESRFAAAWACAALTFSVPLGDAAFWVSPEPLTMAAAMLALTQADEFLRSCRTRFLIAVAAAGAAAWQSSYAGVAVPLFAGMLLLLRREAAWPRPARDAGIVWAAAALPMAAWAARNYAISASRVEYDYSLAALARNFAGVLPTWTDFHLPAPELFSPVGIVLALAAVGAAALLPWAAWRFVECEWRERNFAAWRSAGVFVGFAPVYFVTAAAAAAAGALDPEAQPRWPAPLYAPLTVAAGLALERFFHHERKRAEGRASVPAAALMTALCLWTAGQVAPGSQAIVQANREGVETGWSAPRWTDSMTLKHIEGNPLEGEVYSNAPLLLALRNAGGERYRPLRRSFVGLESQLGAAADGAWLIWFNDAPGNDLFDYGPERMSGWLGLDEKRLFPADDAVVYTVNQEALSRLLEYRTAYGAVVSGRAGEPLMRDVFDVYHWQDSVIYFKEPCAAEDTEERFFIHVYPTDAADLSEDRKQYGFAGESFYFEGKGMIEDGRCLMLYSLPGYGVEMLRTGQLTDQGGIWSAEAMTR